MKNKKAKMIPMPYPIYYGGEENLPESALWMVGAVLAGVIIFLLLMIESLFHPWFSETYFIKAVDLWVGSDLDFDLPIKEVGYIMLRMFLPFLTLGGLGYLAYIIKERITRDIKLKNG